MSFSELLGTKYRNFCTCVPNISTLKNNKKKERKKKNTQISTGRKMVK